MPYDIFISYRRNGGENIARQIEFLLENYGYKVFIDLDACNTASWEKRIKTGIEESKVFLFILSDGALDRCLDESDMVRMEVEYAYQLRKDIIPVNPDRQFVDFPDTCPALVREALGQHTFYDIFSGQHLKTTVNALIEQRIMESVKPSTQTAYNNRKTKHKKSVNLIWWSLAIIGIILISVGAILIFPNQSLFNIKADMGKNIKVAENKGYEPLLNNKDDIVASLSAIDTLVSEKVVNTNPKEKIPVKNERQAKPSIYKVGDYYDVNGVSGVVFTVTNNGRNGKILSLDLSKVQWCTDSEYYKDILIKAEDEYNGKLNTDKIAQYTHTKYPIVQWCSRLGNEWYIPSKEELLIIARNKEKINTTLKKHDATHLQDWYWSSTEYSKKNAWGVDMSTGNAGFKRKHGNMYVRAITKF